ncbi:Ldh family oxidoreductase [Amorphus orientalis]|uniref:(2R)-3-sulfolactate dehydrogenase (NADP+) n=1 Tax=Amorphus orientalis TaxID=649198 RepID=A0AAE3VPX5_9HYPH|nr:Ldh family oxidoreductase [Amorphus orientalis]MDQ0315591.1 (2R)-3-sulfolactate dehydrogenase (NADP+) [Amorphus orientalis]
MSSTRLSLSDIEDLAYQAVLGAGAAEPAAAAMARATRAAERDGIRSHGLHYIPIYCEHVVCGKVDGRAEPVVERPRPGSVRVNARSGFAHPAIEAGFAELVPAARENGVAGLAVFNSYNCGILGYHTERLAAEGLVGLGFTNAPASIAPHGGKTPVIGTNPFSLAVPGDPEARVLIDQSASTVAKSEIMMRAREGEAIPEGWALDADGNATTDPEAALKGSMTPSGGAKGFGAGLMVEIFAAALSGATLGKDASPFSGTAGGPPKTGQFFFAVDPEPFSGGAFADRIADLVAAIDAQDGARVPGSRRFANRAPADRDGVDVADALLERIRAYVK